MKMYLSKETKPIALEKMFRREFPFLKLQIDYKAPVRKDKISLPFVPAPASFAEISDNFSEGNLDISKFQTIAEIETMFSTKFGLPVKILRKCGNAYTPCSAQDNYTLDMQNRLGRRSSEPVLRSELLL